jgi:urocanate hydratase
VRGLDTEGRAVSVAASIAGAACLAVESRAEVCRAALRAGACDFVVNSVDEALRILKNELRKRKPVSVAVAMPESAALEELAARGVAPEVFVGKGGERFAEFGARLVESTGATGLMAEYVAARGLSVQEFWFGSAAELKDFDQRVAGVVPDGDPRRRWVTSAPGFFYRERPPRRVVYLTGDEAEALG